MKNFFEEHVSESFKNRVFKSVEPELKKNKQQHFKKYLLIFAPTLMAVCLIAVLSLRYIQSTNPFLFEKESELVILSSNEIELYENMELLEHLEDIENMDVPENSEDSI